MIGHLKLVKDQEPEVHAFFEKAFQKADVDQDGYLQEEEIPNLFDYINHNEL